MITANHSPNNAYFSPRNDHSCAPFLPLFTSMVTMVASGRSNISPNLLVRADVTNAHLDALCHFKILPKEQIMNYSYLSSMFGPILIGTGLLISGGLIVGLANADIYPKTQKRTVVNAKKLDVNNDGLISLDELTSRQNQRFQKLDRNDDGQIDEAEFNARLVAMFNRMDSNSDGMLDDVEISKLKHRHHGKRHNSG
ncbi:hypothetical protein OAJ84_02045 [Candidatus Puniceispirillum sp.]|nr:hypothetical protein [Candidatus Puniceispirillum sp.]